jgi:GntR family transcriptional regulator/MocR family aminotransferase
MAIPVENFFLDNTTPGTLQTRVQQMIASGILSGRFEQGEKLPSTRKLAEYLGVSRITVSLAFTELQSNDYLISKDRSGFYVSKNAPPPPSFSEKIGVRDTVDWSKMIGQRFSIENWPAKPQNWSSFPFPFIYGQTDPSLFDHSNWRQCALMALGAKDFSSLTSDYYDQDDIELIEFILRHSLPRRGITASTDQVLVTMGAQNALWLATQVLLNQRRTAAIENPSYPPLRDILDQSRCHVKAVNLDQYGLIPDQIPEETSVIFTTPSHQCPTTITMPLNRRQQLLETASKLDALVVEDDYEFEISSKKSASPALKSLDSDGRVIYVGSFSKSLFPGLRLGYLVGSAPFISEARALRASVLRHPPGHIQRTAAHFLRLGHYDALINRMAKQYSIRRSTMAAAIKKYQLEIAGNSSPEGGSSFWMKAPKDLDTEILAKSLMKNGVLIEPGKNFFAPPNQLENYYRLAFSSINEEKIEGGIKLVADLIKKFTD